MGDDGGLGWRAALPADLQNHELLTPIQEVKDLGASYVDLSTKHTETGKKVTELEGKLAGAIFKPGDNATDEERTAYFKAIGRPDKAEVYKLEKLTPPEGVTIDQNMEGWFRGIAHQAGLNATQAAMLHKSYADAYFAAHKAGEEQKVKDKEKGAEDLKKEWGPKFDENAALVKKATDKFMTPEEKKHMDESGKGNDPVLVRMFHRIGLAMADDKFVPGSTTSGDKKEKGVLSYPSMEGQT